MSGIFFGERFSLFWAASFDRLENHGICFCRWHFLLFCHQKLYEEGSCGKIKMKKQGREMMGSSHLTINLLNVGHYNARNDLSFFKNDKS